MLWKRSGARWVRGLECCERLRHSSNLVKVCCRWRSLTRVRLLLWKTSLCWLWGWEAQLSCSSLSRYAFNLSNADLMTSRFSDGVIRSAFWLLAMMFYSEFVWCYSYSSSLFLVAAGNTNGCVTTHHKKTDLKSCTKERVQSHHSASQSQCCRYANSVISLSVPEPNCLPSQRIQ